MVILLLLKEYFVLHFGHVTPTPKNIILCMALTWTQTQTWKLGMVVHAFNHISREMKAGGPGVQAQSLLRAYLNFKKENSKLEFG